MRVHENREVEYRSWSLDQLAKSLFFHQKLHEWNLLSVAESIEKVKGEALDWSDSSTLGITEQAWNKVIHNGIKPLIIFAHPFILNTVTGAVGYYRMLAMVSQKSMSRVGLAIRSYELGNRNPDEATSRVIAHHLNSIISRLIELDNVLNIRGFDLWCGMAAGSQAQGSWQNAKGHEMEEVVKGVIIRRLQDKFLIQSQPESRMVLRDERLIIFADEPDIAIYEQGQIQVALEIKGGHRYSGCVGASGGSCQKPAACKRSESASCNHSPDTPSVHNTSSRT